MCMDAKFTEVDFGGFVMCQFGFVKLYFLEFPLSFWLEWATRNNFSWALEGRGEVAAI